MHSSYKKIFTISKNQQENKTTEGGDPSASSSSTAASASPTTGAAQTPKITGGPEPKVMNVEDFVRNMKEKGDYEKFLDNIRSVLDAQPEEETKQHMKHPGRRKRNTSQASDSGTI